MIKFDRLVIFIVMIEISIASKLTGLEPFCTVELPKNMLICREFTSFSELNFRNLSDIYSNVVIEPNASLRLKIDSSLNFQGLKLIPLQIDSSIVPARITFRNIYGFDSEYNPFVNIEFIMSKKTTSLVEVEFSQSEWFSQFDCVDFDPDKKYFLSNLNLHSLILNNVRFITPICPLLFSNTRIKSWNFESIPTTIKYATSSEFDLLYVDVESLRLAFYNQRSFFIDENTLLNRLIFARVTSILVEYSQVDGVDDGVMYHFDALRSFKLMNVDLVDLFKNGFAWMSSLNPTVDLYSLLDQGGLTMNNAFFFQFMLNDLMFNDRNLCKFKNYPHSRFVVPLFASFPSDQLPIRLPCSCLVYWYYKDYPRYAFLFNNSTNWNRHFVPEYFPFHCLNISSVVFEEQIQYCNNQMAIQIDCENTTTTHDSTVSFSSTAIPTCYASTNTDPNIKLCSCSFEGSLNVLNCGNPLIGQLPGNFESDVAWDYVDFVGSSVSEIRKSSFRNLRLREKATIQVSNIEAFENDIFYESLVYENSFRFVITNSSLMSLGRSLSFRDTNFTQLEFKNCYIDQILVSGFEGTQVDSLIINGANKDSVGPFFRRNTILSKEPVVKRLKVVDVYDVYSVNSAYEYCVDYIILNDFMFRALEEFEFRNVRLDCIDSAPLSYLPQLRVLRLENVNLAGVVNYYFTQQLPSIIQQTGFIDYNSSELNWVSNGQLERIYLGHEFDYGLETNRKSSTFFQFDNEHLCFFAGLKKETTIYIYDNLDSEAGVKCTCTVYWIYRMLDFEKLATDPDRKLIPNCIQELNTTQNVITRLDECLNGTNPLDYCKYLPETSTRSSTLQTTEPTETTQTTETTETTQTTQTTTTETTKPSVTIETTENTISKTIASLETSRISTSDMSKTSTDTTITSPSTADRSTTSLTIEGTTTIMTSQSQSTITSKQDTTATTEKNKLETELGRISSILTAIAVVLPILMFINIVAIAGYIIYTVINRKSARVGIANDESSFELNRNDQHHNNTINVNNNISNQNTFDDRNGINYSTHNDENGQSVSFV